MSMDKAGKRDLTGLITSKPSLDEEDEIKYTENQQLSSQLEEESDVSFSSGTNIGDFGSLVSKEIAHDILKRYSLNNPAFVLKNHDNVVMYHKPATSNLQIRPKKQSSDERSSKSSIIHRKTTGVQYDVPSDIEISYSKSNTVRNEGVNRMTCKTNAHSHTGIPSVPAGNKEYAEKMTYCRPVNDYYNEELIFKTMEKNRRLQKLVKKLAIVREKEKKEDAWNNYINELKSKHRFNASPSCMPPIPPAMRCDQRAHTNFIEDFYKTRFKCEQSNLCRNLVKDLYEPYISHSNYYDYENFDYDRIPRIRSSTMTLRRNTNVGHPLSPDNYLILNRDMSNQCGSQYYNSHVPKDVYDNTIYVDRQCSSSAHDSKRCNKSTVVYKKRTPHVLRTSSIQTHLKLLPLKDKRQESRETVKHDLNKLSENIHRFKEQVDKVKEQRSNSLDSIESKLDVLIKSINTLIAEVRDKSISKNSSLANHNIITISRSVDAVGVPIHDYMLHDLASSTPKIGSNYSPRALDFAGTSKIKNIFVEEVNKSNKIKRDIEDLLNGGMKSHYATQITDDIPTKDHSTEVTDSLSNTVKNVEEVRRGFNDGRMAMAVNTDPLGLLALLRISKEAVKNILSYMQSFPYQYLLQTPQLRENANVTPFACSVCGAAFMKTSQLAEHVHSHVKNRDCCVCRHLMGMQTQNPRRIFFCEYCGKPFSRAYCCELHQQTCARRLGRIRDVTSSLVLLR